METTKNNSSRTTKLILITMASLSALIFLASIILHSKPTLIINDIADFAVHHYFLSGFIALVAVLICLKFYMGLNGNQNRTNLIKRENKIIRQLKRRERLQKITKKFSIKMQTVKSHLIDKKNVSDLSFEKNDVLNDLDDKYRREEDLKRAMMLGNNYKHKVKLFFKDKFMNKHVETTVWNANSNHVTLKGGIVLPVKSIYKVEI
ncbi:MAG: hypothetical protein SFY56_09850 [Bacteroidota bacterium]|nr:hypothetical protein [Bacteroidota bacterium]